MVLRTSAVPAHAGPASCARILRARHHEIRCSYNRHIQRARQMKGKHRLEAGRLRAPSTVWPQEVQQETRGRHVCATAPSRSGSR